MDFIVDETKQKVEAFVRKVCIDFANDFHDDIAALIDDDFDVDVEPNNWFENARAPYFGDDCDVPAKCVNVFVRFKQKHENHDHERKLCLYTSVYFDKMKMPYAAGEYKDEGDWLRCRLYEGLHDRLVIAKVEQAADDRARARVMSDMRMPVPSPSRLLNEMNDKGVFTTSVRESPWF